MNQPNYPTVTSLKGAVHGRACAHTNPRIQTARLRGGYKLPFTFEYDHLRGFALTTINNKPSTSSPAIPLAVEITDPSNPMATSAYIKLRVKFAYDYLWTPELSRRRPRCHQRVHWQGILLPHIPQVLGEYFYLSIRFI